MSHLPPTFRGACDPCHAPHSDIVTRMLEAVRPFQCEECGREVEPRRGGMCFGCNRLLCAEHFALRAPDRESAKRPEYECDRCRGRGGAGARA